VVEDKHGHGTHLASVIASSRKARRGNGSVESNSVAPDASLLIVKAFNEDGNGSYLDVIRGIDWIVQNKEVYGIRVLNLSFSAVPRSYYWDDPLNQAVMAAWQSGIVVVASAGNRGPEPMSIGVPGNVPYVITVGAMTDNRTPLDPSDDLLASFSSAGPTHAGFVKPELIAPGGRVLADHHGQDLVAGLDADGLRVGLDPGGVERRGAAGRNRQSASRHEGGHH
jgi:subtilisin family serine protease